MSTSTTSGAVSRGSGGAEDEDYLALRVGVSKGLVRVGDAPVFRTSAKNLSEVFLRSLPEWMRGHYTCNACCKFIDAYGGLAEVVEGGALRSLFWSGPPLDPDSDFASAVTACRRAVVSSGISGVFLVDSRGRLAARDRTIGVPLSRSAKAPGGVWHHLHAFVPCERVYSPSGLGETAEQKEAEKRQDFEVLSRAVEEFDAGVAGAAALLLEGPFFRAEKAVGVARWFRDLHLRLHDAPKSRRANILWQAAATAPLGYCHVRNTVLGSLLEDIKAGKTPEAATRAFEVKMDPLRYQRPQAAPTVGQIDAAEKIVERLGSAGSLARRYASLDDVRGRALWLPPSSPATPPRGAAGVFSHLRGPLVSSSGSIPGVAQVSWAKFVRSVLPHADGVSLLVARQRASYFAFLTAADPSSPPILQWDSVEGRNPVSWYFYAEGSYPNAWNLSPGQEAAVLGVFAQPSSWTGTSTHHGEGAYLVLAGARDVQSAKVGLGLFPEILKAEYRAVRASIEAFSQKGVLGLPPSWDPACGLAFRPGGLAFRPGSPPIQLRVRRGGRWSTYQIQVWE